MEKDIRVVAIRFNLEKESDKRFYELLSRRENNVYDAISQYAKSIICKYLNKLEEEERKKLNETEAKQEADELVENVYDEVLGTL